MQSLYCILFPQGDDDFIMVLTEIGEYMDRPPYDFFTNVTVQLVSPNPAENPIPSCLTSLLNIPSSAIDGLRFNGAIGKTPGSPYLQTVIKVQGLPAIQGRTKPQKAGLENLTGY